MLLLVAAFFLLSSASAFADGTDDFSTITAANTYGTYTSTAGWTATYAQVLDKINGSSITGTDGSTSTHAIVINGKTTSVGTITSPTLSDGCSTLSLNYTNVYAESKGVKFQVDIVQNETTVATYTVENTSVTKYTTYTWNQEGIGVSGDFSIKITNLSPSSSSSKNIDRVAIWNIAWTSSGGSTTTKSAANLAFSQTSYSLEQGVDKFTAPTFSKSTTADVTFSSDNEKVATVSSDGTISLAGGLGTAVITASSEANEDYNAGTATCTIEVYSYNVYKKVTSITSGKQYLLVAQRNDSTMYAYPLSESKTYGYMSTGTITELTDEISVKTTYDDDFTITAVDGGYTIQDCYDRYLYQNGTYTTFQVGTDSYTWTIEPQDDGTFKISMNDYYIQWGQGTYKTFSLYTEAQAKAVLPMLYELVEYGSFTIGEDGYATYYDAKAYVMPEGVEGGIITDANISGTSGESGTLTISYEYEAGETVPAGTALLLKGAPATYTFEYTTSDKIAPTGNMLHGADAVDGKDYTYVEGTNVKYYLLSHYNGKLGFFWYAAEGAAILYKSPYAFLAVDFGDSASGVKMFTLSEESTGIRSLAGDEDGTRSAAIYTLAGQRVSGMTKGGLYIVNGKKVLVK